MKHYILLLVPLIFISCSGNQNFNVIGKWKLMGPQNVETGVNIEFEKDQYFVRDLSNNTLGTYSYKWEANNTMVSKGEKDLKSDTSIYNFITQDSIIVTTTRGIYSTLIRIKN